MDTLRKKNSTIYAQYITICKTKKGAQGKVSRICETQKYTWNLRN